MTSPRPGTTPNTSAPSAPASTQASTRASTHESARQSLRDSAAARSVLGWLPVPPRSALAPTWRAARPARIAAALARAGQTDPGGWCVVAASSELGERSLTRRIAGREVVVWRTSDGRVAAGPGACPHLGALLDDCEVIDSQVVCRWHGLALGPHTGSGWSALPSHDDGVLVWVRLPVSGEGTRDLPRLATRPDPTESIAAVLSMPARCEPRDIIANRLDPWHGAWFHPYAFSHLTVDEKASGPDLLVLDVAFRLGRRFAVPVRAQFSCPDARTIVMTIVDGEGAGSVVETHATSIGTDGAGHPVTMMTEATVATSSRPGFVLARRFSRSMVQLGMRATARRLWVDDLAYAERLYTMRNC
jgi:nitrite reductase/ring-hydroxylating ferredoxin subunit